MKKIYNKEFKKGLVFGAGFVFVVILFVFALSKTELVSGHQTPIETNDLDRSRENMMGRMHSMSIEEMDKDGDGMCDMGGMPVEQCKKMHGSENGTSDLGMENMMNRMHSMSIEEMDKDGDGMCDMGGMPVEQCKKMHGSENGMMHTSSCSAMHKNMEAE